MAVIDQDNFSSVSWSSERDNATSSHGLTDSHNPSEPFSPSGGEETHDHDPDRSSTGGADNSTLDCTVTEPIKENDGTKDAYVSYLITTSVSESCSDSYPVCLIVIAK